MPARRVRLALAVAAVLLLLVPALSAQNSHARIVRLSFIDGQVQIDRNAGQGMEKAIQNMPVVEGTRLDVEEGSHAEIEFENDSTMRLVGPAQVTFRELTLDPDGNKNTLVAIQSGLAYFNLPKVKDNEFRVAFDNHTFAVKKNSQFRVDASGEAQTLAVTKGELELLGEPKEVAVKKNETISFRPGEAQYALAKGVDSLGADAWNHDREQDRQMIARSDQYHASNSYYGKNYGMYDLARYGNWYFGPGYGWLWRPYFYDASYAYDPFAWDPFGFGSWSYYPGAGWTFISGYPWGWAPYRYGSWLFVPGYGWSWRPGAPSYGWQTMPTVINAPSGFGIPRPPNKTAGPTVPMTVPSIRPTAPTRGVAGVPRPGQTINRDIVPMRRGAVPPGALNAGRVGHVRAIGVPNSAPSMMKGRTNPEGMTRTVPGQAAPPTQKRPETQQNPQPHATPPPAQSRPAPQANPPAPRMPSAAPPPIMRTPPSAAPQGTRGGGKPH